MKRIPFLVLAALGLSLAACGDDGGGGDEEAFCEALEDLSDQVADGDLASDDGLDDVADTANDLLEAADDDQAAAIEDLRDVFEEAAPDEAEDTAEEIRDELGAFAETCDIDDDEFAVAPTTTEPEPTTTTAEPTTTTTEGTTPTTGGGTDDLLPVTQPQPVPEGISAEFAALADECEAGAVLVCDELFEAASAPIDKEYGDTCGGRIPPGSGLFCGRVFPEPSPPGPDVEDVEAAQACFDGVMAACDSMLGEPGPDQDYGYYCGGRIDATIASTEELCVAIFGDTAVR